MNWRKLTKDMSTSDVKKILGEPHRVDGGTFTHWYYQNHGGVIFYEGKVDRWMEPRQ
jgi:outer membrane protein assembly factor BamE (lipoprotein component of BamABCDE complex)